MADDRLLSTVLTDPGFWAAPSEHQARVFAAMRRRTGVTWQDEPPTEWNPNGGRGFWSVTSHSLVSEVSRRVDVYGSRHGTEIQDLDAEIVAGAGMLNMDAPEHTRLRAIVSRAFTRQRVADLRSGIDAFCDRLLDRISDLGSFDFVDEVADVFPAAIIGQLMDVPTEDHPLLVSLTKRILSPDVGDAKLANREMIRYGMGLADMKLKTPGDDLVSRIAHADADGGHLTVEEIGVFFALLLTAGIETTGTSLNHAVTAFDTHRDQRELWMSDLDRFGSGAVEEILRWSSPVRRFRRTALVDAELDGVRISAGDKVVVWYCSANRDERVFDEPDRFDITRSPNPHLAFGGGGQHFCLGANLARAEIHSFMTKFLTRFPDYGVNGEVEYSANDAFNAVASVPLTITPDKGHKHT